MIDLEIETVEKPIVNLFDRRVQVVVLNIDNEKSNLPTKPTYDTDILGKKMTQWVVDAMDGYTVNSVNASAENDIVSVIMPYAKDSDYVVVLYCDTPLITKQTIEMALDFVCAKSMQVCKLDRGYIFATEYLRTAEHIYATRSESFNPDEFFAVTNVAGLVKVTELLQQRINDFHIRRGVAILQPSTTRIGAGVSIGTGVTIYGNNSIMGNSVLSDNVLLRENNILDDAVLLKGASTEASVIKNSVLMENSKVLPFSVIENNSVVKEGEIIKSFSHLNDRR